MRQTYFFAFLVAAVMTDSAHAQVGSPGIEYGNTIAAGDGVQLYPYDQQDPWLHGHFQRVPSYGGFASFRPYNYRHVFAQTQLAQTWGHAHGMPYSQQFWNRYRSSYLEGNLHTDHLPVMQNPQVPTYPIQMNPTPVLPQHPYPQQPNPPEPNPPQPYPTQGHLNQGSPNSAYPVSAVRAIGYQTQNLSQRPYSAAEPDRSMNFTQRPIHVAPERMNRR